MSEITWYDISPTLSPNIALFPGDKPYHRTVTADFKNQDNLLLSYITTSVHAGAHTDAPCHYHNNGQSIEERPLHYYLGRTQVVRVPKKSAPFRLYPEDITTIITEPRVLFHTESFPDPNTWRDDFTALSPELIHYLAQKNVLLVGIDTPSIDPAPATILLTHEAVYAHNMAILEGITLTHVPEGAYHLIALPLKLKDSDASPVRAILLKSDHISLKLCNNSASCLTLT